MARMDLPILGFHHRFRRGVVISTDREADRVVETKLKRCVHCSLTWAPHRGSGRLVGWCERCAGDLCGREVCVRRGCVHFERELELLEQGIPWELIHESMNPVIVAVPRSIIEG